MTVTIIKSLALGKFKKAVVAVSDSVGTAHWSVLKSARFLAALSFVANFKRLLVVFNCFAKGGIERALVSVFHTVRSTDGPVIVSAKRLAIAKSFFHQRDCFFVLSFRFALSYFEHGQVVVSDAVRPANSSKIESGDLMAAFSVVIDLKFLLTVSPRLAKSLVEQAPVVVTVAVGPANRIVHITASFGAALPFVLNLDVPFFTFLFGLASSSPKRANAAVRLPVVAADGTVQERAEFRTAFGRCQLSAVLLRSALGDFKRALVAVLDPVAAANRQVKLRAPFEAAIDW